MERELIKSRVSLLTQISAFMWTHRRREYGKNGLSLLEDTEHNFSVFRAVVFANSIGTRRKCDLKTRDIQVKEKLEWFVSLSKWHLKTFLRDIVNKESKYWNHEKLKMESI